jgi:multidrug/hemolysin transport system permease protein
MRTTLALVGRNLTIYFRDRVGVFLSLLSALILLLLYTLFLGSLQVDTIQESLPNASDDEVRAFVDTWVLAGIIMITTFTTGFGSMGVFVDDRVSGRFRDFRVAPLKRWQLILGYLGAAFVVAVLMATIILAVGVGILMALHSTNLFTWGGIAQSFGLILLLSLAFAAVSAFLLTFVGSSSAYTASSTIVGTVLGFLAGAYLPVGLLTTPVANVINVLPFSPAAMLLREPLVGPSLDALAGGVPQAVTEIEEYYGFTLLIGDVAIEPMWVIVGLVLLAVVFAALGALRIGRVVR